MSPELHRRAHAIASKAIEVSVDARLGLLNRECGDDNSLRAEVEKLLAAEAQAEAQGFLSGEDPLINTSIGRYQIRRCLGQGGMGAVYLAEQTQPIRRLVALKIIKLGMDTRQVIARFEAEREALSLMNHANVAKVLDAGATETGRPYFAMEFVDGTPITTYCDDRRLSTGERLKVFMDACAAVQHAHQKGIIHRDIKPSNVLVTEMDGKPIPKVIDFGIAKATQQQVTERTVFTEQGQMIGTPGYMSPEQAGGNLADIDTRTDVYSLGVMLYELLVGARPFDDAMLRDAGYAEMQRIIREVDPPRPSAKFSDLGEFSTNFAQKRHTEPKTLARQLRGDLDWVLMKCLEKDRTQRYDTASALAIDLQRFLDNEPVVASPPAAAYRLRKFIVRNKGGATAVAAVFASLALGVIGLAWQGRVAARERDRAVQAQREELTQRTFAEGQKQLAERKRAEAEAARDEAETARNIANRERQRADQKAEEAEFEAYVANITAADASLLANEVARVQAHLGACPERLRGWEWRWLNARFDSSITVLRGRTSWVYSAAFSPEGTRIVTASVDKTARVWDAATGLEVTVLRGHEGEVYSAAFSPDGTRIVTSSNDQTARVWDAATAKELNVLRGHEDHVRSAAYSPDGTHIVTASEDKTARVWDAVTGKEVTVLRGHEGEVYSAAFSPDGTRIVTSSNDQTARVWDAATAKELNVLRGHEDHVRSAAYSPNGTHIVTASEDKTARVWDAVTGKEMTVLHGHTENVRSAAFSPDGTRIVSAFGYTARVWDAATSKVVTVLRGHRGHVRSAAFSPDGTRIVTASEDQTARVWDAATAMEPTVLRGHERWVLSANFSPDGTRLVTVSGYTARVRHAVTGKELTVLRGHGDFVRFASFSPDGTRILTASVDTTARVWDAATGKELTALHGHELAVNSAAFSPDGTRIVTASVDKTARVWDGATGKELTVLCGHEGEVSSAAFSPDGTRIVTASYDNTAQVWESATGKDLTVLRGHGHLVLSAAFSPDGAHIVTASWDQTARVWDAATASEQTVLRGHIHPVSSAAFSPDGMRVVTASWDQTARVWDTATARELTVLRGHTHPVSSAAFSPDGSRIVTVSGDTARVWDAVPYRERFPAIECMRNAESKMAPIVRDRLNHGQSPELIYEDFASAGTYSTEELVAARANLTAYVEQRFQETQRNRDEAKDLNHRAWQVVRFAPVTVLDAKEAVATARHAVELAPDTPDILNTLGVALYRAGEYDEALTILTRSEALNEARRPGEQATQWAFIAMAHHQLGQADEANQAFEKLLSIASASRIVSPNDELQTWLNEAAALIEPAASR